MPMTRHGEALAGSIGSNIQREPIDFRNRDQVIFKRR
jgi:hypothetical protein